MVGGVREGMLGEQGALVTPVPTAVSLTMGATSLKFLMLCLMLGRVKLAAGSWCWHPQWHP